MVGAVLYPEFSDLGTGPIDQRAINVVLGFGFIFVSGFALLPALIVVLITEAFYIRSVLAYALGGAQATVVARPLPELGPGQLEVVAQRCEEHLDEARRGRDQVLTGLLA